MAPYSGLISRVDGSGGELHPFAAPYLRQIGYGPVELAYFSIDNVTRVMSMIIERVAAVSGNAIGPQDERELVLAMRAIYLNACGPQTVEQLNLRAVDKCTEVIVVNMQSHANYVERVTEMARGPYVSDRPAVENRTAATSGGMEITRIP
jgi:hypothetical protein